MYSLNTKKLRTVAAMQIPLFFVTACAAPVASIRQSPSDGTQSLDRPARSATQVVSEYYKYIALGESREAAQFLTPELVSQFNSEPDSDFNNVQSISNVRVSKAYESRLDKKYKYEVQVDAEFKAQYDQVITVGNGPQTRFIYLGRDSNQQLWHIISIGTGP